MANKLQHIAIIMDGNGRWARERGLPRLEGHRAGAEQIRQVAGAARRLGVKYLTLYAFSTENWHRPPSEVQGLMDLARQFSHNNLDDFMDNGICLRTIGRITDLPAALQNSLSKACEATRANQALTVVLALSYGGRAEIVDAVNAILASRPPNSSITEQEFRQYLYAPDIPDPDLLIRTGGEQRLSNFLLWQLSYAELYVTGTFWPDFGEAELQAAVTEYQRRVRRYGKL
ncbi:MAG: di-trans,poly-cis-decaprenylcistransferase [Lentisphaerae bacterium]|nr:di-trans,poly-cis-decaprenylcistransferase [Lentisphaerota bacterium]